MGAKFGTASGTPPSPVPMTPSRLSLLAALGLACLASSVLLVKTTPLAKPSILDSIYS